MLRNEGKHIRFIVKYVSSYPMFNNLSVSIYLLSNLRKITQVHSEKFKRLLNKSNGEVLGMYIKQKTVSLHC